MYVIMLYLFIVGIFFGSFYNVVAMRLCKNESIVFPGSHCVNCNHRLSWYELIPVFSYLFLGGKCKKCKQHISIQYPLVEIITGLLFAFSYWIFGFTFETLLSLVICSVVIITFISDSKFMVILDEVLVIGIILIGILYTIQLGWMVLLTKLLDGLIIFGIVLIIKFLGDRVFKQESLGWGDVKLSFLAGMILGIKIGIVYIVLASFLAFPYALYVSIKNKEGILPFGPFLATSMLVLFWNLELANTLLQLLMGV